MPDSPDKLVQAFEAMVGLRGALINQGETRQSLQLLQDLEGLAARMNDDRRRGLVQALFASEHALHGDPDRGAASGARALAIADRLGDAELRAVTQTYLELVYFYRADHARVVELATANLAAPLSGGYIASSIPRAVDARCYLLRSLAELGRFAEAVPQARNVIEQAEPTQSHYPMAWPTWLLDGA